MEKLLLRLLILAVFLIVPWTVQAKTNSSSVNDCIENPQTCEESPKDENSKKDTSLLGTENQTKITFLEVLKLIGSFVFVIGLLYLVLKFLNKKNKLFQGNKMIENIGGVSLGNNRSVQVVKVGERILIVGVGESVQLLKEIEDSAETDRFLQNERNTIEPSTFLNQLFKNRSNTSSEESSEGFSQLFKRQLDGFSEGRKKIYEGLNKDKDIDS